MALDYGAAGVQPWRRWLDWRLLFMQPSTIDIRRILPMIVSVALWKDYDSTSAKNCCYIVG